RSSSLRRYRFGVAVEGGLERVPREGRALHAHGELADAGEDGELAERAGRRADVGGRRQQAVEPLEEVLAVLERLPFEALGHHRGRGGRDRAAVALEADVLDRAVLDVDEDRERVAAERVPAVRFVRDLGRNLEV